MNLNTEYRAYVPEPAPFTFQQVDAGSMFYHPPQAIPSNLHTKAKNLLAVRETAAVRDTWVVNAVKMSTGTHVCIETTAQVLPVVDAVLKPFTRKEHQ